MRIYSLRFQLEIGNYVTVRAMSFEFLMKINLEFPTPHIYNISYKSTLTNMKTVQKIRDIYAKTLLSEYAH
jgi:hypothetical protein